MNTLNARIKERLGIAAGRSQAGLARACKIAPASVSAWVSGKAKSIDGKYLTTAADYLGVNPHWLSTGEGEMLAGMRSCAAPPAPAAPQLIGGLDHMLNDIADERQRQILGAQCVMILTGNVSLMRLLNAQPKQQLDLLPTH
jgi:transcriptional regulator with XRE-family HTH domain